MACKVQLFLLYTAACAFVVLKATPSASNSTEMGGGGNVTSPAAPVTPPAASSTSPAASAAPSTNVTRSNATAHTRTVTPTPTLSVTSSTTSSSTATTSVSVEQASSVAQNTPSNNVSSPSAAAPNDMNKNGTGTTPPTEPQDIVIYVPAGVLNCTDCTISIAPDASAGGSSNFGNPSLHYEIGSFAGTAGGVLLAMCIGMCMFKFCGGVSFSFCKRKSAPRYSSNGMV